MKETTKMSDNISSDEHKLEMCNITREECTEWDCSRCATAKDYHDECEEDDAKNEVLDYTEFERDIRLNDIQLKANSSNTIVKTNVEILSELQKLLVIPKDTTEFDIQSLPHCADKISKLMEHNNFPLPEVIYTEFEAFSAVCYGDDVYLIAPRIVNETDDQAQGE